MVVIDSHPEKEIGDVYIDKDGKEYQIVALHTPNPIPSDWLYSPLCMAWVRRVSHEEEH